MPIQLAQATHHIRLALTRPAFNLNVDFALPAQGITVLFGASGSGKTSLLRCVAGLERANKAFIRITGQVWQDDDASRGQRHFVPTWQRALGYVFQEPSLFDHLDVRANLKYGLARLHATARHAPGTDLDAAIELLGIGHLLTRRPEQLSGGERQRVAIARALATAPQLLLLDEPLASLDPARRQDILPWLERLRDELHIPMLYVTHAMDEVTRLASTLVVLDQGQVAAIGSAHDVLSQASLPGLAGEDLATLLSATVQERDSHWGLTCVSFAGGRLWLSDTGLPLGKTVRLRVLARDVSITTEQPQHTSIQNLLPCTIQAISPDAHPSQRLIQLRCGETALLARITARAVYSLNLAVGQSVWAQVKSVALVG